MDELIRQLVALSSKVAVLESEGRRVAFERPEASAPRVGLPHGVKAPTPAPFHGANDGDSVKNFVEACDTYFELVGLNNPA